MILKIYKFGAAILFSKNEKIIPKNKTPKKLVGKVFLLQ